MCSSSVTAHTSHGHWLHIPAPGAGGESSRGSSALGPCNVHAGGAWQVPLGPGHIPSWNSSISLPGMKVNTPAKSFLDKTYLPRARGSTCPCQWPGMHTGGGSSVCDTAVTGAAAAFTTPGSSPGIHSLWNPLHSFSRVCLSFHCCCCLSCYILCLGNANSTTNGPEFHFALSFGKEFSIHRGFPRKGSVLEHWHHRATSKAGCGTSSWPRVLAAVRKTEGAGGEQSCLGRWGEIFQA